MRAIKNISIIINDLFCIFTRNMRFYISQCIAVQGREVKFRYFSIARIPNVCLRNKMRYHACRIFGGAVGWPLSL